MSLTSIILACIFFGVVFVLIYIKGRKDERKYIEENKNKITFEYDYKIIYEKE